MGYLMKNSDNGKGSLQEWDTVSCKHCQAVIKIVKGAKKGAWCQLCFGPVCETAACSTKFVPLFKKLEEKLKRQALFDSMGI